MKVALYARVSTRGHGQDVETQFNILRREAKVREWEAVEFSEQISALDMDRRTEWGKVLDGVKEGRFEAIVVTRLDRAYRSVEDMIQGMKFLDRYHCNLVCVTQPIDTTSAAGRLFRDIIAAFAEFERDFTVEKIREGLDRAKAQGKRLGRPPGAKDKGKRRNLGYLNFHDQKRRKIIR